MELARRGWEATYLSPRYVHRSSQQVASGVETPSNLKVVEAACWPGSGRFVYVNVLNANAMRRAAKMISTGAWDVVIFNDPRWAGVVRDLPARIKIFDMMDDLSAAAPGSAWARQMEREALALADRVWTGAASMAERVREQHERVRFIPCGVEGERFARPDPADVGRIQEELELLWDKETADAGGRRRPLAGYFGALNERFNMELIAALAKADWRVALIGPKGARMRLKKRSGRIRWIGPRPYAALPAYLACMDMALIPYVTQGPHRYLYPVKALEYLAGAKPVLTTPLPEIERHLKDYVLLGKKKEDWARVGARWPQLREEAMEKARAGQAFVLQRSWAAMAEEMIEELAAGGLR
jgi:UDP-galactopyranose mutase